MKKIAVFTIALFFGLSTLNQFAQSIRVPPQNESQKANKRPPKPIETPKTEEVETPEDPNAEIDDELLKIDTEVVTIPVKVVTRGGRFVSGLTKEDFQVFEGKEEQEIAFFSDELQPFTVALVLDMSYSATFKIGEIQSAAMEFVNQLRENDRVMVVSFDEEVHLLAEPTSDRRALQRAIYSTKIASGTSVYDAIDLVINRKLSRIQGRKAIVLFSDGVDTTSRKAFSNNNVRDAMEFDALIYPIQYDTFSDVQKIKNQKVIVPPTMPGPIPSKNPFPFPIPTGGIGVPSSQGTSVEDYKNADEYLNELANKTNGRLYMAQTTINLATAFSHIAAELRNYYSLGYYPKDKGKPGDRRSMKVKVKKDGVSVRARDSYVVGKNKQ